MSIVVVIVLLSALYNSALRLLFFLSLVFIQVQKMQPSLTELVLKLWINPLVWIKMRAYRDLCNAYSQFILAIFKIVFHFSSFTSLLSSPLSLRCVFGKIFNLSSLCVHFSHRVLFMNLILCNWNNSRVKQLRELHLVIIVSVDELLQQVSLTITCNSCNFRMILKSYSWWSEYNEREEGVRDKMKMSEMQN